MNNLIIELDKSNINDEQIVNYVMKTINNLDQEEFENVRFSVLNLLAQLEVKIDDHFDKKQIAKIICGIAYWQYITNTFAMNMLMIDSVREREIEKIKAISGLEGRTIIAISEKWSKTQS